MLSATRTEWNELYVVFSLLHQGQLVLGNAGGTPSDRSLPICRLTRQEHDGKRDYTIHPDTIELTGEDLHMEVPREDFGTVAALILHTLKTSHQDEPEAPEGVEAFLDALHIYDMEARTDDRTDFYLTFHDTSFPPMGFRIYSRLCTMPALLDGGRTANLKLRQEGIRFAAPAVNKINYTDTPDNADEVARRMLYIESMGGILKYDDVADKVFRANLQLIDLNMGRVLCDMVRTMHLDNVYKVNALTTLLEDPKTGKMRPEVLNEKVLSCIVEMIVPIDRITEIYETLDRVAKEIDTVFSVDLVCRTNADGSVPTLEIMDGAGHWRSINGKTNIGLGKLEVKGAK